MRYSNWKPYTTWAFPTLIFVLTLASFTKGTVVCDGCRPLALQEGPGVGISLSPGHGTAAVEFVNGTVLDIGIIEGTETYIQAIKSWPDARLIWTTPLKPVHMFSRPAKRIMLTIDVGDRFPPCLSTYRLSNPTRSQPQIRESLLPIVDMVQALWRNVNTSIHLEHKKVRLSVPNFTIMNERLNDQLAAILATASLESLGRWPLYRSSLLSLYNLEDCVDDNNVSQCESYPSLRSMIRDDDGMFYPALGTTKLVWREAGKKLEDEIRQFATTDFDLVSLSGPEAPQLHNTVRQIFQDNGKIVPEDYVRSAEDHTFAAARGSAPLARLGMCNNGEACLQNSWCPVSKHCEWAFFSQESEGKEKL